LITALVERWRIETHTLHLPLGETIITLEDMAVHLLCDHLLGSMPLETIYKENSIKLSWLNSEFQDLAYDVDSFMVAQHAREHILTLIRSLLVLDTSGSRVHQMYPLLLSDLNNVSNCSWGSGVLACLYCAHDHGVNFNQGNIGGCMLLLLVLSQDYVFDEVKQAKASKQLEVCPRLCIRVSECDWW